MAIRIANAPCSWGVLEGSGDGQRTYTSVLDEMASSGYDGTELGPWGFMPTEAAQLKRELGSRNLDMVGSWVTHNSQNPAKHARDTEAALTTARLLLEVGGKDNFIILGNFMPDTLERFEIAGRVKPEDGMSDAAWQAFIDGVSQIAEAVKRETGLRTLFHPHGSSWVETPDEVERFLRLSDPGLVNLCYDTGHITFGGGDAAAMLDRHWERVSHIHIKDCSMEVIGRAIEKNWNYHQMIENNVFCQLNEGVVDFARVMEIIKRRGYSGWIVVEQDLGPGQGDPYKNAVANIKQVRAWLDA